MNHEAIKQKSEQYFDMRTRQGITVTEAIRCYPFIANRLKNCTGELLDVGCGTGAALAHIREVCGEKFRYTGIDISRAAVEKATLLLRETAHIQVGDSEYLPYADNTFDVVLCMHSFHHYPNPVNVLKEIKRILVPKEGRLFLVENSHPTYRRLWFNFKLWLRRYPRGDIRFYSWEELSEMGLHAGFSRVFCEAVTENSFLATMET